MLVSKKIGKCSLILFPGCVCARVVLFFFFLKCLDKNFSSLKNQALTCWGGVYCCYFPYQVVFFYLYRVSIWCRSSECFGSVSLTFKEPLFFWANDNSTPRKPGPKRICLTLGAIKSGVGSGYKEAERSGLQKDRRKKLIHGREQGQGTDSNSRWLSGSWSQLFPEAPWPWVLWDIIDSPFLHKLALVVIVTCHLRNVNKYSSRNLNPPVRRKHYWHILITEVVNR